MLCRLLCLLISVAYAKGPQRSTKVKPYPLKMTKVESCQSPEATKTVYVFKQWHLSPTTITKGFKEKYPQEKNQTAIYKAVEDGIKRKQLELLVSEGCEGEIDSEFKPAFNGWNFTGLKQQSQQKGYDKILTLIPLKVEAKYGDRITTLCGDDESLIQEGNLRVSNLRGWMGFYVRLHENREDAGKFQQYANSAAELLKIPKDTPADDLVMQVKTKLKTEIDAFSRSLEGRNDSMVKVLQEHDFKRAAVVIGGLHAEDLKSKLEKAGLGCEIFEPPGYQRENEKLLQEFQGAVATQ